MRTVFDRVYILLLVASVLSLVSAREDLKDDNIDRGSRSDRGGLWFGPRLGKRSLSVTSEDNRQTFLRLLEAADALKYYYDQLQYYDRGDEETKVTKKVIFTPKLGRSLEEKRYEIDFTPRLGRRLADEMPATPPDREYKQDPDQMDSRSKYFSPRLGRNSMNFSPRLGRELAYEVYPEQVRVVRSANKTKAT